MNTSPETSMLSKPEGSKLIPIGTLTYFRGRNRLRAYELVLTEFHNSGLTQADLARRLGKRPEVVSRLLGAPGNWGLDTVSDVLFAIRGGETSYGMHYPLDEPARNDIEPRWLRTDRDQWIEKFQNTGRQTSLSIDEAQIAAAGLKNESKQHHPQPSDKGLYGAFGAAGG